MPQDIHALLNGARVCVAMTGTRSPSVAQADHARRCASRVGFLGHKYVSGGAKGIDTITRASYAHYATAGDVTIYRPDKIAASDKPRLTNILNIALGEQWFKALERKGDYVLNLALRNVLILEDADVLLSWPGSTSGGTQQGMAVAEYLKVPCFDMNAYLA